MQCDYDAINKKVQNFNHHLNRRHINENTGAIKLDLTQRRESTVDACLMSSV